MGKVINISEYERKEVWRPFTLTLYEPEPGIYALNIAQGMDDKIGAKMDLEQSQLNNIRDAIAKELMNDDERYYRTKAN